MNLTFSFWAFLFGRLGIEAGLLVAMAAGIQRLVRSPGMRRTVWQAVFIGVGLTWVSEVGGARRWVTEISKTGKTEQRFRVHVDFEAESAVPNQELQATTGLHSMERIEPIALRRDVWWPLWIWGFGAAFVGLKSLNSRIWLGLASARECRPVTDVPLLTKVENLRRQVGIGGVRMVIWPGLSSPIAFRTRRPTIALPEGFTEQFSRNEQEAMLAHELAHLASGDPFWLGVADLVLAVAWWHPGLWWARHQLREACESAADEASALVPGGRVFLAELLIKLGRDLVAVGVPPGLGIEGGLRSGLAKRVTALLSDSREWQQESPAKQWLTRSTVLGMAVSLTAIPAPGIAGPSLLSVLSASPISATTTREAGTIAHDAKAEPVESSGTRSFANTDDGMGKGLTTSSGHHVFHFSSNDLAQGSPVQPGRIHPAASSPQGVRPPESPLLNRQVVLEVKILEVTESGGGGMDIDWLFAGASTNHSIGRSGPAMDVNQNSGLPSGSTTRIDLIQSNGQSAELMPLQFLALLKRMTDRPGTDVLSTPTVLTLSGRPATVSVMEEKNIVTGIETNQIGFSYHTRTCKIGPSVTLEPELEGNEVRLRISSRITEFLGYDSPKPGASLRIATPDGKTLTGQQPFPHFRVRAMEAEVTGKLRNTVAMRGPMVTNVVHFKSKVPVLGDIPLVGGLFRSGGTSEVLKRLYLFVTPTEVDGAGQPM